MNRDDLIRAGLALVIVAVQYWAIQPYHEPILAKLWQNIMKFCYAVAARFGYMGMVAEHNYYVAVEAGILWASV